MSNKSRSIHIKVAPWLYEELKLQAITQDVTLSWVVRQKLQDTPTNVEAKATPTKPRT